MAYVSFAADEIGTLSETRRPSTTMEGFSPLEWSVVALSERDRMSSLAKSGSIAVAFGGIFGHRHNPALADTRLEALRRVAVMSWHKGQAVSASEVRAFIDAGFSAGQYDTLRASIDASRRKRQLSGFRS